MEAATRTGARSSAEADGWYNLGGEQVAAKLGVDPSVGLSGRRAAELLEQNEPNALPAGPV
jgi:P-type Ca2+ transporter type 2C